VTEHPPSSVDGRKREDARLLISDFWLLISCSPSEIRIRAARSLTSTSDLLFSGLRQSLLGAGR